MCVAIYKPENVQMPSLDTLKKCWEANPDGAGFALFTGGDKYAIEIHKGYMTWKQFKAAFEKYRLADFTGDLLLHFRIATHGGISPGNTHPFSLTKDVKLLKHTNVLTNYALIHNGILPIKPEGDISDTMEFCRRLAPLYQNIPSAFNLIEGMAGNNKIAVMTRDKVHLFGSRRHGRSFNCSIRATARIVTGESFPKTTYSIALNVAKHGRINNRYRYPECK